MAQSLVEDKDLVKHLVKLMIERVGPSLQLVEGMDLDQLEFFSMIKRVGPSLPLVEDMDQAILVL